PVPAHPFGPEDEEDVTALLELGGYDDAAALLGACFAVARQRGVFDDMPVDPCSARARARARDARISARSSGCSRARSRPTARTRDDPRCSAGVAQRGRMITRPPDSDSRSHSLASEL